MLDGGPLDAPPQPAAGKAKLPRAFGTYELLEEVARGGMGVVYRARQLQIKRDVAVKVLAAGQFASPDFVKRFRTEAEAVASLDHPHIVPIYEVGECEGQPFFSMKFVERGSLARRISDLKSQIPNREAAALLAKLARAVHYAHQRGILHRDLKPGNVLLDAQGEPHLTDFGLAKLVAKDSTLTHTIAMLGTPSYMSPEQARGEAKQLTTAVDVYGLGAVFYELLTGQPPFAGGTTMATVRLVLDQEPRRPSALRPGIPRDLETICLKCLEKDPARRYGSAEALAEDLEAWLEHRPICARPVTPAERVVKWMQRKPLVATLVVALHCVAVLGLAGILWQWREAVSAKQAAVQQRDLGQQRLYDSLVREARSIRTLRPLGFRRPLLDRIQQARAIPAATNNLDLLRTEVAQCLGDPLSFDAARLVDPPVSFLDVALNRDGSLAAFATAQGELVLHETARGKVIGRLETRSPLAQLAFAPDGHSLYGRALAPGDERSGATPRTRLIEWQRAGDGSWAQHSERSLPELRRLVMTTQGVLLALEEDAKREIRLVNAATDRTVGSMPLPLGQPFPEAFDVSPDGRLAAYVCAGGTNESGSLVEVWDLAAPASRLRLSPGLGPVLHLDFSPDGRFLACTADNGILVCETSRFQTVNTYRQYGASRAVWCGDGTRLAVPLYQENGVRLCSVNSGTEAARVTTPHQVKAVRGSLDGAVLLVAPLTGPTLVVRLTGSPERRHLTGHMGGVTGVEFSPDGRTLASTGKDGVIRLWEVQTGRMLRAWPGHEQHLAGQTIAFSPDGRWLASGNYHNHQVRVWSLADGRPLLELGDGRPESSGTWSCGFSPDGKVLVAAGDGLRGWEIVPRTAGATEPPLAATELFHDPGDARNLQFHPTGQWIAYEGHLRRDGQNLSGSFTRGLEPAAEPELVHPHASAVQTLGVGGDGSTLLHMDRDRCLVASSVQTRQTVHSLPTLAAGESASTYVGNFRVSPDGSRVAVANHNGRGVNLYHLASGRRLYSLPDDPGSVWWLAWHPDGRQLAVARGDGDISLWNLTEVEAVLAEVGLAP